MMIKAGTGLTVKHYTLGGILFIAIFYFFLMLVVNNYGATTGHVFSLVGGDEGIMYPYVENMFAQTTLKNTLLALMFYGDYTYGFPFYLLSYLVLLPVRLLTGELFFDMYQVNLLLLRQMISVAPMLLAAGVIVYLKTRFRTFWISVLLYLSLLLLPGVLQQSMWFWHPDALGVLLASLALLFLDRDEFKLGKHFLISAVWVGLASSTRMIGYWFVVAIAGYLLYAWLKKKVPLKKVMLAAFLFLVVMIAVILITSPYLWFETHRTRFIERFQYKAVEFREGYPSNDLYYYQLGARFWSFTLRHWYMNWNYLAFVAVSMVLGLVLGRNKKINWLIFGWTMPFLIYVLYFFAPKPPHYLLPTLLFAFAAVVDIPLWIMEAWGQAKKKWHWRAGLALLFFLVVVLFSYQIQDSALRSRAMYLERLEQGIQLVRDYCPL